MRRRAFDQGVIDAFIVLPPVVAVGWLLLLSGGFDEAPAAILWVLFAFALRPAIWLLASKREKISDAQAERYRERQRYSTNTSFAIVGVIGLIALDVVRIPGGPFWSDQPRATFALLPLVVYLVWLSRSADIPRELSESWRGLLGRKEGSRQDG